MKSRHRLAVKLVLLMPTLALAGEEIVIRQTTEFKRRQCKAWVYHALPIAESDSLNTEDSRPLDDPERKQDVADEIETADNQGYRAEIDAQNPGSISPLSGCTAEVTELNTVETKNATVMEWEKQKTNGKIRTSGKTSTEFDQMHFRILDTDDPTPVSTIEVRYLGIPDDQIEISFPLQASKSLTAREWRHTLSRYKKLEAPITLTSEITEDTLERYRQIILTKIEDSLPPFDGKPQKMTLSFNLPDGSIQKKEVLIRDYSVNFTLGSEPIKVKLVNTSTLQNAIVDLPSAKKEITLKAEILE